MKNLKKILGLNECNVKRHIVGDGNCRLFSVYPSLLIVWYRCDGSLESARLQIIVVLFE